jgi:hypothetical protein
LPAIGQTGRPEPQHTTMPSDPLLRIYVPASLAMAMGWPFQTPYAVIAWLCWVPHLMAAPWWLSPDRQAPRQEAFLQ